MATRVERRLAAILAADVVGYSRLVEQNEADTLAALRALRREVINPRMAEHHGRIVKLMGDGIIAEFGSVVDAVACAVAMQKGMADQQVEVPAERRIVFRIGINLGDVVVEGEDLLGDGVNIAARLEQICQSGSVMISGTAFDHLQGKLDLPVEFAGEARVKNIERPIRTYRVRLDGVRSARALLRRHPRGWIPAAIALLLTLVLGAGVFLWLQKAETVPVGLPSIAVLPFDNLSRDEATGRLADGITEDIITDLARFREFDVIARNSTGVYKGKSVDVRQVGKDLNVRYVLEGSIQRQGEQIRATAQLIDASTAAHVWSERWDRPAADVFAVQTEIAEQVAARLGGWGGRIAAAEGRLSQRKRPEDLSAYELYLRGLEVFSRGGGGKDATEEAIRLLTQAVEKDPHLARAWTALSGAYDYTASFGADLHSANEQAKKAAERAIALDPADADAHRALAEVLLNLGDIPRGFAEFDEGLRLNPGNAAILANFGAAAIRLGQPERGLEAIDRAMRLNPHYGIGAANRFRGAYFWAGRYEDALRIVERQPVDSRGLGAWLQRAASYAALGRLEEARAAVADALARHPNLTIQGFLSRPDISDAEKPKYEELMRKAGIPVCAKPEELAKSAKPLRLTECANEVRRP